MKRTKISYSVEAEISTVDYDDGNARYGTMRQMESQLAEDLDRLGYRQQPGKYPSWSLLGRWGGAGPVWREHTWAETASAGPDMLKIVLTATVYAPTVAPVDATLTPV